MRHKGDLVEAIVAELHLQQDFLPSKRLESVYFGGGTPSLLTERELNRIFEKILSLYSLADTAEITLEANPDDLDAETLAFLKKTPVNRLSIGVQSFFEADLRWMNRAHNAAQSEASIKRAQDAGFENLTVDLIFGSPTTEDGHWAENLEKITELDVPHLSSYCLTVEDKTALAHLVKKGVSPAPSEERALHQYLMLMDWAERADWHHYEISNLAKKGFEAVHNSNYWRGLPYLGIGPSAHSFDGNNKRSWNRANNTAYRNALREGRIPCETELLSDADRYNEYVMTGLRRSVGVSHEEMSRFGVGFSGYFLQEIMPYVESGMVELSEGRHRLTRHGKLKADAIASDLFWVS